MRKLPSEGRNDGQKGDKFTHTVILRLRLCLQSSIFVFLPRDASLCGRLQFSCMLACSVHFTISTKSLTVACSHGSLFSSTQNAPVRVVTHNTGLLLLDLLVLHVTGDINCCCCDLLSQRQICQERVHMQLKTQCKSHPFKMFCSCCSTQQHSRHSRQKQLKTKQFQGKLMHTNHTSSVGGRILGYQYIYRGLQLCKFKHLEKIYS